MEDSTFLDRHEHIDIRKPGNLPHWEQTNKFQFVTFRLADSLPQSLISYILKRRESFKIFHPEPWDEITRTQYEEISSTVESELLDNGYGACHLRKPETRKILEETIAANDMTDYHTVAYVIMPNHVHILLQPINNHTVAKIISTIKSVSSHKINKLLMRSGRLWHIEYYDRIIRNRGHFENVISYIRKNPENLPESDYTLYINRKYFPQG